MSQAGSPERRVSTRYRGTNPGIWMTGVRAPRPALQRSTMRPSGFTSNDPAPRSELVEDHVDLGLDLEIGSVLPSHCKEVEQGTVIAGAVGVEEPGTAVAMRASRTALQGPAEFRLFHLS
jgi:hypothetical protein